MTATWISSRKRMIIRAENATLSRADAWHPSDIVHGVARQQLTRAAGASWECGLWAEGCCSCCRRMMLCCSLPTNTAIVRCCSSCWPTHHLLHNCSLLMLRRMIARERLLVLLLVLCTTVVFPATSCDKMQQAERRWTLQRTAGCPYSRGHDMK